MTTSNAASAAATTASASAATDNNAIGNNNEKITLLPETIKGKADWRSFRSFQLEKLGSRHPIRMRMVETVNDQTT